MKLDFNKMIYPIAFAIIPIYVLFNRIGFDISIGSMLLEAFIIEVFVILIAESNKKVIKIIALVAAGICAFVFNDIDSIKMGLEELLDSYSALVKAEKNGNTIIGALNPDSYYIKYITRIYLEIAVACLYCVYNNKLWKVIYIDITIPFLILILAAGITPDLQETILFIIMYVMLVVMPAKRNNVINISSVHAKKVILIYGVMITYIILKITNVFINEDNYTRSEKFVQLKYEINQYMSGEKKFTFENVIADIMEQFGIEFSGKAQGGLSDGELGKVDKIEFTGEKVMDVFVESDKGIANSYPLYIKNYVGSEYTGDKWNKLSYSDQKILDNFIDKYDLSYADIENIQQDLMKYRYNYLHTYNDMSSSVVTIFMEDKESKENYWLYLSDTNDEFLYDGQHKDLDDEFVMKSYVVSGYSTIPDYKDVNEIYFVYGSYPYIDSSSLLQSQEDELLKNVEILKAYEEVVNKIYTHIPESFEEIADEIRKDEYKYLGTEFVMDREIRDLTKVYGYEPYIEYVQNFLSARCEYTLSPGKLKSGEDFVNKFLLETNKGYCTHFASAGVLMFRSMGIPARYVSGYVVTDGVNDGGKIVSEVRDDSAHAWVEIYISGLGWRPVEVTPAGYRDIIDKETDSPQTSQIETTVEGETTEIEVTTEEEKTTEGVTSWEDKTTTKEGGNEEKTTSDSDIEEKTTQSGESENGTDDENDKNDDDSQSGASKRKSKIIKLFLWIIIILAIIIGFITYIVTRRQKKIAHIKEILESDDYNKAFDIMLNQLFTIANMIGKPIYMINTTANVAAVIKSMGKELDDETCIDVSESIYKHCFSNENMSKDETDSMVNLVRYITIHQYNNSNILRKTYMSFIKCLYLYKK